MLEFDEIRKVLELAKSNGFREIETEVGGVSFYAKLEPMLASQEVASDAMENDREFPVESEEFAEVCAPCVGYFRQAQTPVQVGQTVVETDIVATIMALGLSNDVEAKLGGEVVDVLAKHEQPVEFGQPLFRIKVNA